MELFLNLRKLYVDTYFLIQFINYISLSYSIYKKQLGIENWFV